MNIRGIPKDFICAETADGRTVAINPRYIRHIERQSDGDTYIFTITDSFKIKGDSVKINFGVSKWE